LASPVVSAPAWRLPASIAIALLTLHCGGPPFVEEAADGSVVADDSVAPEAATHMCPIVTDFGCCTTTGVCGCGVGGVV
jgi:hypothetical protein